MSKNSFKNWFKFLFRRIILLLIVLILVTSVAFFVTRFIGSPVYLMVGSQRSEEILESTRQELNLDKPLAVQYFIYINDLLHGDLGISRFTYNPVIDDLKRRLPATLELATVSIILISILGIILGFTAAVKQESFLGKFANGISSIGVSVAPFWLALMLIYIFYFICRIAPAPIGRIASDINPPTHYSGFYLIDSLLTGNIDAFVSSVYHLMLPVSVLVFTTIPYIFKLVYSDTVEVLKSNYIQNARAFGLKKIIIYRYVLKNIAPSLLTLIATNFAWLISADIVIEKVFSWPGLGLYVINAMNNSDYCPVIAIVLFAAIVYNLLYFLTDVCNIIIDPRWDIELGGN